LATELKFTVQAFYCAINSADNNVDMHSALG